jgi:diadenosine tetraphosphate (Ap4A) HIT family hydrolase
VSAAVSDCSVCAIQAGMEAGDDPFAVARLQTSYVQLNPLQHYRGYTFVSSRRCATELFELEGDERALHLHEMTEVAHAVFRAFGPRKLNLEALGNSASHLHWHVVPRHADDPRAFAPIWENLDYLRLVWTGQREEDDAVRVATRDRLLEELDAADVDVEQAFG